MHFITVLASLMATWCFMSWQHETWCFMATIETLRQLLILDMWLASILTSWTLGLVPDLPSGSWPPSTRLRGGSGSCFLGFWSLQPEDVVVSVHVLRLWHWAFWLSTRKTGIYVNCFGKLYQGRRVGQPFYPYKAGCIMCASFWDWLA